MSNNVLVVGSTGLDDIQTPSGKVKNALGGAAFYGSIASSFFAPSALLGIVGDDFPGRHINFCKKRKINLNGLEIVKNGKTFRWSGKYHQDMNTRDTLDLQLNTFLQFNPVLDKQNAVSPFVFLANIDPELHLGVIKQLKKPAFILADTMDHWINTKLPVLKNLLKKVTCFVINDSEAQLLTGQDNLVRAAAALRKLGPKIVIIKKGEHGALLDDGGRLFMAPAFPLEKVVDPTGAGDTFAGAFTGYLASKKKITHAALREAVIYGTVVASYTCSAFSVEMLKKINRRDINSRFTQIKNLTGF